jgi:DNA topoisomerase I
MKDKALVIVESPSKAKTIGKILGSHYKVVASKGHVRDLPKSRLGIDIENDFEPDYISIRGKGDIIKMLKKEAKSATKVYLATDPDREGEAISWHIAYLLGMSPDSLCRIEFNEITKNAVKAAIKNPRAIDLKLVDAQQARRVLDRLVGYQISPLLWRKISGGLSAGRVQSATLKIICDREKEIQAFVPEEYWTVTAEFKKDKKKFKGELFSKNGKKIKLTSKADTDAVLADLKKGDYRVAKVEEKERQRKPAAPFTTSTLQQAAGNRLGFGTRKTMQIAQELYEGVDIKGMGTVGLVTYIRTDSVRISAEAKENAKNLILSDYGEAYVGNNFYTNKKKDVQDAHEAIRPANPALRPSDIKDSLTSDQYKLYNIIWERFMASQMSAAVYDAVSVDIENGAYTLRATGSTIKFAGYLKVYENDKTSGDEKEKDVILPKLASGDVLDASEPAGEQHFTQPPARYTEASLVKELEDKNIGRPSTYAPIVGTLTTRRYVKRESKKLVPTELGMLVTDLMSTYFKDIVDVGFTADMEDKLDSVETDGVYWKSVISDFYVNFEKDLKHAEESIEKLEVKNQLTGEMCPECGKPLVLRRGRYGDFIACSGYPECKYTKPIVDELDVKCPKCGKSIVVKRSRRGKVFYGCSGYPDCTQTYWNKPVNRTCPECGALMTEKKGKGYSYICSNPECGHKDQGETDGAEKKETEGSAVS